VVVLPLPVGPVTSSMPCGSSRVHAIVRTVCPKTQQIERHRLVAGNAIAPCQQTKDRVLAEHAGHDRHTQIHAGDAKLKPETPVLRVRRSVMSSWAST